MIVQIGADGVRVVEPDVLDRLHVELVDVGPATADAALRSAGLGRLPEPGHAFLEIDTLLREAGGTDPAGTWLEGFARMVEFARSHGWTSDDGRAVRAHVVEINNSKATG